jgi:HEAT repeat protein
MKNSSDDAKLLEDFRAAALDYGEALEIGNHKAANHAASLGGRLKKEIVARGNPTVGRLLKMLDDRNPWIRLAAAVSTLDIEPGRAYQVLAELQAFPKAIGSAAFTIIRMWETGALPAQ